MIDSDDLEGMYTYTVYITVFGQMRKKHVFFCRELANRRLTKELMAFFSRRKPATLIQTTDLLK